MRALNPLTSIMCGFTAWIIVVGLNNPWVSATVIIAALVVGTATTRNLSLIATTLALSLPTGLSMLLIYVPFAATYRDGLVTAGQLSLRAHGCPHPRAGQSPPNRSHPPQHEFHPGLRHPIPAPSPRHHPAHA